ncbi:MAG: ABC transporter substrate-binding protein [Acetobacterium sp.]
MMKKLTIIGLVLVLMFSFAGCQKETAGQKTLTIGLMASADAIPIILADQQGLFEKEQVQVKYEIFKSAKDRDAAYQSGNLDGIIGDQIAVCLYQNAGFDLKIASSTICDHLLIAGKDSGITSMKDIGGKTVAISENTVIEYTLDKMLEAQNIDPGSIVKTAIPAIPVRVEMLTNNKVDLALLPEPFASLAIKDGGVVLGKASEMELYPSVIAFSQEASTNKKDEIKLFFKAYDAAIDFANTNPIASYENIVIDTIGFPIEMKGQIVLPTFEKSGLPSDEELQNAIDWVNVNQLSDKKLVPKDLLMQQ